MRQETRVVQYIYLGIYSCVCIKHILKDNLKNYTYLSFPQIKSFLGNLILNIT